MLATNLVALLKYVHLLVLSMILEQVICLNLKEVAEVLEMTFSLQINCFLYLNSPKEGQLFSSIVYIEIKLAQVFK